MRLNECFEGSCGETSIIIGDNVLPGTERTYEFCADKFDEGVDVSLFGSCTCRPFSQVLYGNEDVAVPIR